ncbi:MAG: hypothetical protein ACTHLK_18835 [Brucella intermedia]
MKVPNLPHYSFDNILKIVSLFFCIACGLTAVIAIVLIQARSIMYFNQSPFDGVFQTLFPLRKMDQGEFPGRDFYYFHGNGIPYLIYPFYKIASIFLDGDLGASIASAYFVNVIFVFIPMYFLCRLFMGWRGSLITLMLFSIVVEYLPVFGYFLSPTFIGAPMGVRMSPHIFMAIAVAKVALRTSTGEISFPATLQRLIIVGAVGAAMPLLGAEQGFYAVAAAAGAVFFLGGRRWRILQRIGFTAAVLVSFSLFFVAALLILFGSLETITALRDISDNQVWIYGVFPNSFFASWTEFFTLQLSGAVPSQLTTIVGTVTLMICFGLLIKEVLALPAFLTVLVLFAGGLLSWVANFGYVGQHQAPLFLRECIRALALSATAIMGKGAKPTGTREIVASEVSL